MRGRKNEFVEAHNGLDKIIKLNLLNLFVDA